MKIKKKFLSNTLKSSVESAKRKVQLKYQLSPGNNVYLICEKLAALRTIQGAYVECGVFRGNTLFTVATFMEELSIDKSVYGFDTFHGFPHDKTDERDQPKFFHALIERGLISKQHFQKAAQRTQQFRDKSHLKKDYFLNINNVFNTAKDFKKVQLIQGVFKERLRDLSEPISVLFLDCDLYQSYKDCLSILYSQVISKGAIIFDEYYSLKYPGPRLAVEEFFKDKDGHFEMYTTKEGFERWCFIKTGFRS